MIETEIKFTVENPAVMRKKLKQAGAKFGGKYSSKNILLDTPDWALRKKGCLLRVRLQKGEDVLTFKGKAMQSRFKKRLETNLMVRDGKSALTILKALGFEQKWVYEKKTEFWMLGKAHITLDQMPKAGYFLEIEAKPWEIKKTVKALGLDLCTGMKDTYADLFKKFKECGLLKGKNWVFG